MLQKKKNVFIGIICIVALCMVVTPLLILGFYDYPCADDWSFGADVYQCIKSGGNIFEIIATVIEVVFLWRIKGEPRFANAFLGALQPGIWGEGFYWITPWLMIGSIIVSEITLACCFLKSQGRINIFKIIPIVVPSLMIQLLCVPYPVETFYWWTGAVNYTFIYSVSLILFVLFWNLTKEQNGKAAAIVKIVIGIILAVVVGADNYATSLSMVCLFVSFSIMLGIRKRKAFWKTLPITLVITFCLVICLAAPGNQVRLESEFGGSTIGAGNAVLMSLYRTALNIYSWTEPKIIIMLLLIAPFLWFALKETEYEFRNPALFTAYTFGLYASQVVATMYVGANTGGERMADILYYAYHVWILLNAGYWVGWIQRKQAAWPPALTGLRNAVRRVGTVRWFFAMGILLTICMSFGIKTTSTYRACAWLLKGDAKAYAEAWEERIKVLHDETVKEVYFAPLPGHSGDMIFYADFQSGENWINTACACYYEKDHVGLAEQ